MTAKLKLVSIGNSKGVRIPSELIRRYRFQDQVQITELTDGIFIQSTSKGKLSLAHSFEAMAKDSKSAAETRSWAESGLSDGLDNEEDFKNWKGSKK